jgi:hypothetical protein
MRRLFLVPVVVLALLAPVSASGGKGGTKTTPAKTSKAKSSKPKAAKKPAAAKPKRQSSTKAAVSVARDDKGHIQRSDAARHAFARQTGYPHGRPGYVIDHIIPLACGGADTPSNMQWQTVAEAKAKDKTERAHCR